MVGLVAREVLPRLALVVPGLVLVMVHEGSGRALDLLYGCAE